jgi:Sec-independent protein secretion pathway component TatC
MMALPLVVFYEIGIVLARVLGRRRDAAAAAAAAKAG